MTLMVPLQTTAESLTNSLLQWPQVLGLPVLALAVWVVWNRTQDDSDPSGSLALRTDTGALSVSISGAYWVALLAGVAVSLAWDAFMQFPLLLAVPIGLVGIAWWLEKQEAMS